MFSSCVVRRLKRIDYGFDSCCPGKQKTKRIFPAAKVRISMTPRRGPGAAHVGAGRPLAAGPGGGAGAA